MTPEERDRLVAVETRVGGIDEWLKSIATDVKELRATADMGKGAWVFMLKVGGVIGAIVAFGAWVFDKFHK